MSAKTLAIPAFSLRHLHVWRRNSLVWRKLALPSLLGNLADPMIYMFGLGFGIGALLADVDGVPYIAFLAAGDAKLRLTLAESGLTLLRELSAEGIHDGSLEQGAAANSVTVYQVLRPTGEIEYGS